MSQCEGQECTHSSHTEEKAVEQTFEQKLEAVLREEKGKVPMGIGAKMYLDKLHRVFKDELAEIFSQYTQEISRVSDGFRTSTLEQMNAALEKLDKKYRAMYGDLVNRFLVKQEQKVFAAELAVQSLIDIVGTRFHQFDMATKTADDEGYVKLETYLENLQKQVEDKMESLAIKLKEEAVERMRKQAAGEEKQDAEVAQEATAEAVQQEASAEAPAQNSN